MNLNGNGYGLRISKAIVECMGGSLTVESKIKQGTTFVIKVDLAACNIQENQPGE